MDHCHLLKIGSYNCRGARNKTEYFTTLLSKVDILCVQEHRLFEAQLSFLGDIHHNFGYIAVSDCKLFRLLIDHGLLPCIIRMLNCLYTNHKVCVAWNGVHSQYFLATNGVKQGGVLSPVLYLLYIDGLLIKLTKSGIGCFLVLFVGALAYADDLALLAPTAIAMRKLLSICVAYGKAFRIKFNTKKSKWLAIMLVVIIWIECHRMIALEML